MVRILIPFIAGIIVARFIEVSSLHLLCALLLLLSLAVTLHYFLKARINLKLQKVLSLLVLFIYFLVGQLTSQVHQESNYEGHYANLTDKQGTLLVRVIDQPTEKQKSIGCKVELYQIETDTQVLSVRGKAQLYFAKNNLSRAIQYGDFLLIGKEIEAIGKPTNPYQFDFAKYYASQNIYHQVFLDSTSWLSADSNRSSMIWKFSYDVREYLKLQFVANFPNKDVRGVAEALVFGYKDDLNEQWLQAFSRTGTIHVLAVSGLHVGIIFFLLNLILRVNSSKGKALLIKSVLIILFLFGYCMLTGFAPSVSRATIMFSTVVIAKALNRQSNIYNTLALSAFILLVIDSNNLFHVGFQFSYLAVLGIVYYKDIFRSWIPARTWLQDKVASLLAVSVAAQITTFPLGLYYFHQYPNLFFISNLLVIPCVTVILYACLATICLGLFSNVLAAALAKLASIYIVFVASVVHFIQDIPYAFFDGVHITFSQMIMLYLLVFSLTVTLRYKWNKGWWLSIVSVVGFLVADLSYERGLNENEVVVFDVRNEVLVGLKDMDNFTVLASRKVYDNPSTFSFLLEPYVVNSRLRPNFAMIPIALSKKSIGTKSLSLEGNGIIWHNNRSYLFLDYLKTYVSDTLEVDVLFIGKSKSENYLNKVTPLIKSKKVIYLNNWKNAAIVMKTDSNTIRQRRSIVMKD